MHVLTAEEHSYLIDLLFIWEAVIRLTEKLQMKESQLQQELFQELKRTEDLQIAVLLWFKDPKL